MKERFEGAGRHHLITCLQRQELVLGDIAVAEEIAREGTLIEFKKGEKIVTQDGEDNDIYFIIAGEVSVVIKGMEYRKRFPGEAIGELAAVNPVLKRTADVVALETVVTVQLSNAAFMAIGDKFR